MHNNKNRFIIIHNFLKITWSLVNLIYDTEAVMLIFDIELVALNMKCDSNIKL